MPGSQHPLQEPSVSVGETSRLETATRLETASPPETATRRPGIVARVGSTLSARRLDRRDRLVFLGLAGLLALGVALHLWGLGRIGMRGDEAVYAGQAAVLAGAEGYDRHFLLASRGNSNFLLYQELLSLVYRLVGVGDLAARLMSAILSTATVVVVFLTGRALYGRSAALLGALLLTISSYALSLGRLALLDPLVALLYTLALLCMIQWDRSRRTGWLVALAVTVSLAIQAKIVGVLLGVVFVGYLLLTGRWRALTWRGCCSPVPRS